MSVDFVDKSREPPSLEDAVEALREWDKGFTNGSLLKIPSLAVQCSTIRAVLKIYVALMRRQTVVITPPMKGNPNVKGNA